MQVLTRTLRIALTALALSGLVFATGTVPTPTTTAGSSGQPGDVDVG